MSSITKHDPFYPAHMSDFMKRFFGESFLRFFENWPLAEDEIQPLAVDVSEKDGKLMVEASLPGVKPEEMDISVVDNVLTIKAESKQEKDEKRGKYHYRERRYGAWQRDVLLPERVDVNKAEAEFVNGVLNLSLPIVEGEKIKRIKVKSK
jgi:HSP20 family protein